MGISEKNPKTASGFLTKIAAMGVALPIGLARAAKQAVVDGKSFKEVQSSTEDFMDKALNAATEFGDKHDHEISHAAEHVIKHAIDHALKK